MNKIPILIIGLINLIMAVMHLTLGQALNWSGFTMPPSELINMLFGLKERWLAHKLLGFSSNMLQ